MLQPKCRYCGDTDPEHGFEEKTIIHRDRDDYTGKTIVRKSKMTVCKSTKCGGSLQMSYQG